MIVFLNLCSFVFGLFAWILPIVNLVRNGKNEQRNWIALPIMSISACAISLCFQIFSINHRVKVADWSALMDTMNAVAFISAVLLLVTIILNTITLIKYRDRTAK
jgi:cytochrome c oxidase subunit 4